MNWYYARGDERMGPVDEAQIVALASTGQITPQTLVWREGMADWMPWGRAPQPLTADGLQAGAAHDGSAQSLLGYQPCAACGRTFLADEMVAYQHILVCGDCKPVFFQRLREGADPFAMNFAGFWIRFCARLVDGVIFFLLNGIMTLLQVVLIGGFHESVTGETSGMDTAISIIFFVLYIGMDVAYGTYFIGRFGATPGKMVLKLKVIRSDGSPVSYRRALGRYFATWLSQLTLLIGFIMAAFDGQKRALHDHICDTRVVQQ